MHSFALSWGPFKRRAQQPLQGTGSDRKGAAEAAAATEATCARHRRRHATAVSSASLRSPPGRRAIGRVGARRFDAAGACVVQAPEDGCHKQQQRQRQQAAHVDAAAARSVVMPLSRAAAVCVPPPCHL